MIMNRLSKVLIVTILLLLIYSQVHPQQRLFVPSDKIDETISILKDTGYYNNLTISSITFTSTEKVTSICEMSPGHTAIGCTQPHPIYSHTFDIYIANDYDLLTWQSTLYHEIAHVECDTEACANAYMNSKGVV